MEHLKYVYGLNRVDYELMLHKQKGKCLVCRCRLVTPRIDHDHMTGSVRGILCNECNCGIGFLRDSVALLEKAANYMRRSMRQQEEDEPLSTELAERDDPVLDAYRDAIKDARYIMNQYKGKIPEDAWVCLRKIIYSVKLK